MIKPIKELAEVQSGHPFRGSVPLAQHGNALALQMRDVNIDGVIAWDSLVRTQIDEVREPQWLQNGDVIFVARGARNYAVALQDVPPRTVCSQYFFLLRVKTDALLPAFLAWQINRAPAQRYLASNAEGSDQLSIRRGVLETLQLAIPPLPKQQMIVSLAEAAAQEKMQLEALIHNRQRQLDALAFELFTNSISSEK